MISESAAKRFFPCFYNSAILICGVWHIAISIFWVQKPCTGNREYSQQNQIHLKLWTKMHCLMGGQQMFGARVFLVSLHVQHQVLIWANCRSEILINELSPRGSHLSSTLPKLILPEGFTASYIWILPEQQNLSHYSLWWVEAQDSEISTYMDDMGVTAFSPTTYLQD